MSCPGGGQQRNLMFYTTENGAYDIDKFAGSASDELFYGADKRDDNEIGIHYGRRTNSYIWYDKTRADEHLMRINTTGVTTVDRALKAISRLDYANDYLSKWRAVSGAQRKPFRARVQRQRCHGGEP